jgi:hypothetical protein
MQGRMRDGPPDDLHSAIFASWGKGVFLHLKPDDLRPGHQKQHGYYAAIREKMRQGKSGEALFFDLALEDITRAAAHDEKNFEFGRLGEGLHIRCRPSIAAGDEHGDVFLRHQGCEFFFLSCRSLLSHRFPATASATPPAPAVPRSIWSSSSSQATSSSPAPPSPLAQLEGPRTPKVQSRARDTKSSLRFRSQRHTPGRFRQRRRDTGQVCAGKQNQATRANHGSDFQVYHDSGIAP